MVQVPIRCRCGAITGEASWDWKRDPRRIVCYCGDCQAYLRFLEQPEYLDPHGGTEIIPVYPAHLKLRGVDNLKCVRLSSDGPYRWYAGCCKTPIANSILPSLPFAGLMYTALALPDATSRERVLGPIHGRIHQNFAYGDLTERASRSSVFRVIFISILFLLRGLIRKKGQPSPFFGPGGKPIVDPLVLSDEEYEGLRGS